MGEKSILKAVCVIWTTLNVNGFLNLTATFNIILYELLQLNYAKRIQQYGAIVSLISF